MVRERLFNAPWFLKFLIKRYESLDVETKTMIIRKLKRYIDLGIICEIILINTKTRIVEVPVANTILNSSSVPAYLHILVYKPNIAKVTIVIIVIGKRLSAYTTNHLSKPTLVISNSNLSKNAVMKAILTSNTSTIKRIEILMNFAMKFACC
jgi:hypothetical protein